MLYIYLFNEYAEPADQQRISLCSVLSQKIKYITTANAV